MDDRPDWVSESDERVGGCSVSVACESVESVWDAVRASESVAVRVAAAVTVSVVERDSVGPST